MVVWNYFIDDVESYISLFSTSTRQWSVVSLFEYDVDGIIYQRGVNVDNQLAIVFRYIITDDSVSFFLWLSGPELLPTNEACYTFFKQIDDLPQGYQFIGYHNNMLVYSDSQYEDVAFCNGDVTMLENLEEVDADHHSVNSIDEFYFSLHSES